ncbi:CHAT domain-containing protein [Leptothoe spongobia]|uniref:CHAT domain-containing protein n=1 Tax=Leptothoe spongobia TAU-MAC 1115 TaxID=1967444 RepID=A0A947DFV7_9CYAN|nr:CHAT domain-containing protein [Leptothoe spongobia]MBT9315889.1 CHAT domain-containing protein [Leptothoe spongobia TAU-MAC 1115]
MAAAQAQSITSADTVTSVQQNGTQFQIDGGNLSGDSTTLFHSFDQFGLLTGESVQFANPVTVENIVGRVIGGDASIIDGGLGVNGDANLYLLNPAGIFLGENTQLNLGGSFSASTATGLIFGEELLDVLGTNDYTRLTGTPTGYGFDHEQASAVVNTGDLSVGSGQALTLLGGQVINTGPLSAPGGEVLVMAVPGKNRVRLSQTGSLLDLELETLSVEAAQPVSAFTVATIPTLLTGASALGMATDITVHLDGTVSLSGSSLQVPLDSNTVVVSGQLDADSGNIGVFGDQIALIGTNVDASGDIGGGTVLIGGDESGAGSVPNATATVIDETSIVRADARDNGNGGKIVAWGTNLLSSAGQLFARGGANGGDGGFIETSSLGQLNVAIAPDISAVNGLGGLWLLDPPNIRIVEGNVVINISGVNPFDASGFGADESLLGVDLILNALADGGNVEVRTMGDTPGDGNITLETPLDYDTTNGTLNLLAEGEINILEDIFDSSDEIDFISEEGEFSFLPSDSINLNLTANGQITVEGSILTQGGQVSIISNQAGVNAVDINTGGIDVEGNVVSGEITIQANDNIFVADGLFTAGDDILLETQQGSINFAAQEESIEVLPSISSFGGDITLTALQGSVDVAEFISTSPFEVVSAAAGDVTVESQDFISVDGILANAFNVDGGQVTLKSQGDVVFSFINTISETEAGGDVIVESSLGNVRGTDVISFVPPSGSSEPGGEIIEPFPEGEDLEVIVPEPEIIVLDPEELSATIVTDGFASDGTITITHGGGNRIPFDIGDATVNGTAGSLTTGTTTLEDGNPNEPFLGSFDAGDIQIITTDDPPVVEPPVVEPPVVEPPVVEPPVVEPPEIDPCVTDCQADVNLPHDERDPGGGVNTLLTPEVLIKRFEEKITSDVANHLKSSLAEGDSLSMFNGQGGAAADLSTARANLRKVQGQTGKRPALIYAVFGASDSPADAANILQTSTASDPLELLLVTAEGEPHYVQLSATRREVLKLAQRFRRQVTTPTRINTKTYLQPGQGLYKLLIEPLEAELKAQNIDTISFITDTGLRSIPLAALHDGQNFIIQNYNIGLMPSLSLTDLTYQDLNNVSALVAGASTFANQAPLPGVSIEIDAIASERPSKVLKDDAFSLDMLKNERQQIPYGIIHLATHGEFNVGDLSQSYLYLHDERLRLDQLRTIGLNRPTVELITLSACQTALGNRSAELGFAGFAVLAGAKTSIASLWNVNDEASAGFMIEFYRQLQENQPIIKAEALRQAQLAMLRGDISIEDDQLKGLAESHQLPDELAIEGRADFRHPYYWAAFSLVGSPW